MSSQEKGFEFLGVDRNAEDEAANCGIRAWKHWILEHTGRNKKNKYHAVCSRYSVFRWGEAGPSSVALHFILGAHGLLPHSDLQGLGLGFGFRVQRYSRARNMHS